MTSELLTQEDYTKILQEKFGTNNIKFKNASYSPISENAEGFAGAHYILQLTYTLNNEEKTQSFFVKTKPSSTSGSQVINEIINKKNIYQKEIFLYDYLLKEYEKYGYDVSFAPKCYLCKPYETMVMENLNIRDFTLYPRKNYYDLEHCKMSLKALAQFHANAFMYEETKSKELGKTFTLLNHKPEIFNEVFFILDETEDFGSKFFRTTYEGYAKVVELMNEPEEWKKSFKERILSLDLPKIFHKKLPYRKTVCHGDLWSNNMLFKNSNGVPIHCCLVDYQLLRYHHPSFDVVLILYSNTTPQFLKEHLQYLLDYYYSSFEQILKKNNFEAEAILPKEDFLKAADEFKIVAMLQGASARLVTMLPPEILTAAAKSGGEELEKIMLTDKRTELILEACDDEYRKCIYGDVYSMNDAL